MNYNTMRINKGLIIIYFLALAAFTNAQAPLKYFTDTSCLITASPLRILSGQQIVVQCDTAYLLNKYRFKLYEKSRVFIQNQDPEKQLAAIGEYEKMLNSANKSYQEIMQKYKTVFDLHKKDLDEFQKRLDLAAKELDTAKAELDKAKKDLEDARKQVSRKKNSTFKTALIWGGSGLITGLILSLII